MEPARGLALIRRPAILVADDDDELLEALDELLSGPYDLTFARDGREAMAAVRLRPFDLAIIDLNLPVVDGFKLVEAILGTGHHTDQLQSSAVMFLSGQSAPQLKAKALSLGAVDYMTKPFDVDELMARIARILAGVTREASLRAEAMTDALTGLPNYRSFSESLERELERSRRYGLPLSLVTVDLDHLKSINDKRGHEVGNEALRMTARVLAAGVRRFEVVARQGGDEFAIILPSTASSDARLLAERLRAEISAQILHGEPLSASFGVASLTEAFCDAPTLRKASDEALYRAKRAGRDRVAVADP
jgi:two-component system, cell cycle response regulator